MSEPIYAQIDDFQKAAARIATLANNGLQDAQLRLASEGFFKRAKLSRTFEPSMKLLRELLAPISTMGMQLVRDPAAAKAYCESMAHTIGPHVRLALDADPGSRRLVLGTVSMMMESTAEALTKGTHDRCWHGSERLADEMRRVFGT